MFKFIKKKIVLFSLFNKIYILPCSLRKEIGCEINVLSSSMNSKSIPSIFYRNMCSKSHVLTIIPISIDWWLAYTKGQLFRMMFLWQFLLYNKRIFVIQKSWFEAIFFFFFYKYCSIKEFSWYKKKSDLTLFLQMIFWLHL